MSRRCGRRLPKSRHSTSHCHHSYWAPKSRSASARIDPLDSASCRVPRPASLGNWAAPSTRQLKSCWGSSYCYTFNFSFHCSPSPSGQVLYICPFPGLIFWEDFWFLSGTAVINRQSDRISLIGRLSLSSIAFYNCQNFAESLYLATGTNQYLPKQRWHIETKQIFATLFHIIELLKYKRNWVSMNYSAYSLELKENSNWYAISI